MLFNSPEFLVFLPIVFGLYWFVTHRHLRAQNLLLLVASYVFYGWWDWRFLGLIALSTLVDYFVGIRIEEADDRQRKKRWLWVSLAVNLGILGYFKYANFFIENWITAWDGLGVTMHASTLQIILPVGISFYTFQTLSYSIDIYRGNLKATRTPSPSPPSSPSFPSSSRGPSSAPPTSCRRSPRPANSPTSRGATACASSSGACSRRSSSPTPVRPTSTCASTTPRPSPAPPSSSAPSSSPSRSTGTSPGTPTSPSAPPSSSASS